MSSSPETPPDQAISHSLSAFAAGRMPRDQACRDLAQAFASDAPDLEDHLRVVLDDIHARRITADEARRDLCRAATAARRGDRYFLALLSPVHA